MLIGDKTSHILKICFPHWNHTLPLFLSSLEVIYIYPEVRRQKRGVNEGTFCPVWALILNYITISLGKFKSQWGGFKKKGCHLLPWRPPEIQPGKPKQRMMKTRGTSMMVRGSENERKWEVIRHSQQQSFLTLSWTISHSTPVGHFL